MDTTRNTHISLSDRNSFWPELSMPMFFPGARQPDFCRSLFVTERGLVKSEAVAEKGSMLPAKPLHGAGLGLGGLYA